LLPHRCGERWNPDGVGEEIPVYVGKTGEILVESRESLAFGGVQNLEELG